MTQTSAGPRAMGGFTLMEVMVAIVIMAMIAVMTSQSFSTAMQSSEATQEAIERLAKVDRVWVLLENDIRNMMPLVPQVENAEPLPAIYVADSGEYRLTLLRGGYANPLHLPRTEMVRIGYRFEESVLWRDTWINIADNDERNAKPQKILDNIEEIYIKVLRAENSSFSGGPWGEQWPATGLPLHAIPAALEVTLKLEDFGEIKRYFTFLPGLDNTLLNIPGPNGAGQPVPPPGTGQPSEGIPGEPPVGEF
jgi:general secretion pathway protein J